MELTNAKRAEVLVRALPYIKDYSGKIRRLTVLWALE